MTITARSVRLDEARRQYDGLAKAHFGAARKIPEGSLDRLNMIVEKAYAKINLALHVVGRRPDGFHLLQSLVTFGGPCDLLRFAPSDQDRFSISGRFASLLEPDRSEQSNLVLIARDRLRNDIFQRTGLAAAPLDIRLEKNLPVASGIGGGSADAAAALRGLNRIWSAGLSPSELCRLGIDIGADVPMCIESRPLLAEGIGEKLKPVSELPSFAILLANPLTPVATPSVFRKLENKDNPGFELPPTPASRQAWITLIKACRNDLQIPAVALAPQIGEVLDLLESTNPVVARMSGSGATCFGLYETAGQAEAARQRLEGIRPDWYLYAGQTSEGKYLGAH